MGHSQLGRGNRRLRNVPCGTYTYAILDPDGHVALRRRPNGQTEFALFHRPESAHATIAVEAPEPGYRVVRCDGGITRFPRGK